MKGKAVFARARDARPGLRELPGGPARVAQPSRIDDIREARFDAYRARTGGQAAESTEDQATAREDEQSQRRAETARASLPASRDPEAWRALNDAAAAYRERLAAARTEVTKPAAAEVNQRGMAAVREALRHRP